MRICKLPSCKAIMNKDTMNMLTSVFGEFAYVFLLDMYLKMHTDLTFSTLCQRAFQSCCINFHPTSNHLWVFFGKFLKKF